MKDKIVLIGGYPKGYDVPFHHKTTSGRILRKIVEDLKIDPIYYDLWNSKEEEDSKILDKRVQNKLIKFEKDGYILISLGKYIEKVLIENGVKSRYLPHPASRDRKYVEILRSGLKSVVDSLNY